MFPSKRFAESREVEAIKSPQEHVSICDKAIIEHFFKVLWVISANWRHNGQPEQIWMGERYANR